MELCDTLRRRGRLEGAVRARHEGLQRALAEPLHQALADGAAAVQVAEPPLALGRRPWGVDEVLQLEEQVFHTAEALQGSHWAEQLLEASSQLLRHAPDLPELAVQATEAAALRRRLRRHLWRHPPGPSAAEGAQLPRLPPEALPGEVLKALALALEAAQSERHAAQGELEITVAKCVELLAPWK